MGKDDHERGPHERPRGRRCKIFRADLADLTSLFAAGGVVQLRGGAPRDATLKLAWVDHERAQLCLLVHSNGYGLVHAGEVFTNVEPFELGVLIELPVEVDGFELLPSDRFFVEGELAIDDPGFGGVVGWTCGRCGRERPTQELAVVVPLPIVGRYCGSCAAEEGVGR